MTSEQRARIIRETRENLARFRNEGSGTGGASPDRPDAARSTDGFSPSCRRPADPPPIDADPIAKWRADGERLARDREEGRAELRRAERQHTERDQEFWQSVDARIAAALDAEREFMTSMLHGALAAMNDVADATGDRFEALDTKLDALGKLLKQLREGNESAQRRAREARADADDDDAGFGEVITKTVN